MTMKKMMEMLIREHVKNNKYLDDIKRIKVMNVLLEEIDVQYTRYTVWTEQIDTIKLRGEWSVILYHDCSDPRVTYEDEYAL